MKLRKIALGGAAAAFTLAGIGTSANADYRAEPWTGFYLGAQFGGAWGDGDVNYPNIPQANSHTKLDGVVGGGQFGFNKQFGGLVLGAEVSLTNGPRGQESIQGPVVVPTTQNIDIGPVVQVVGRVGYAWGPTLLYGLGGYADGKVDERVQESGGAAILDEQWHDGWVAGGGAEPSAPSECGRWPRVSPCEPGR